MLKILCQYQIKMLYQVYAKIPHVIIVSSTNENYYVEFYKNVVSGSNENCYSILCEKYYVDIR
jgi:hypothetical protein